MLLKEVSERQTEYLIFICSNRISFYMAQCAIFAKLFSYLFNTSMHFSTPFPDREMP